MKYLYLLIGFLGIILLFSCGKDTTAIDPSEELIKSDLRYGSYSANKLDVYLPANRDSTTPLLVLIHGGGWTQGDKKDISILQKELIKKGIASVSVNYRFAGYKVHYEDMMQDIASAVQYCCDNHENWNIRKDKYMIGGVSAGAHMALLYAYHYDDDNRIVGVISGSGPTDVTDKSWLTSIIQPAGTVGLLKMIEWMVGADYIQDQPLDPKYKDASPRYHIRNIPTLLLHGTKDLIIPYAQSQILASDLISAGVTNKLVTFPDAGHELIYFNPINDQLLTEIETWCKTYGR